MNTLLMAVEFSRLMAAFFSSAKFEPAMLPEVSIISMILTGALPSATLAVSAAATGASSLTVTVSVLLALSPSPSVTV